MKQPDLFNLPEYESPELCPDKDAESSRHALKTRLQGLMEKPVNVKITDNRRIMVSWSPEESSGTLNLRAHRIFLAAPPHVVEALAGMTVKVPGAREIIHRFIGENCHKIRRPRRHRALHPMGILFDLRDIHAHLNQQLLGGKSKARVTWGAPVRRRRVRRMRFGTYDYETGIITLNQRLNAPDIPRYMVEFVMYHEMLHEMLGADVSRSGRRRVHTRHFRELEKAFPEYDKAMVFQKKRWGLK
jgi:hypothetical protein